VTRKRICFSRIESEGMEGNGKREKMRREGGNGRAQSCTLAARIRHEEESKTNAFKEDTRSK